MSAPKLLAAAVVLAAVLALVGRSPKSTPAPATAADIRGWPAAPMTAAERVRAKDQIAEEVIAGRMSLAEAAARFGRLNRLADSVPMDDERLYDQVINWVHGMIWFDPDRVAVVMARLEAEYRAEQQRHGPERRPDPVAPSPVGAK